MQPEAPARTWNCDLWLDYCAMTGLMIIIIIIIIIIVNEILSRRLVGTAIKRAVAVGAEKAGPPVEPDGSKVFVRVEGDNHEDAVFK
jgi:hypothetical protein